MLSLISYEDSKIKSYAVVNSSFIFFTDFLHEIQVFYTTFKMKKDWTVYFMCIQM